MCLSAKLGFFVLLVVAVTPSSGLRKPIRIDLKVWEDIKGTFDFVGDKFSKSWIKGIFGNIPEWFTNEAEEQKPVEVAKSQVGYFLRTMPELAHGSALVLGLPSWMEGNVLYRMVPSKWGEGMNYHYDGFASPMRFDFTNGTMRWRQAALESGAWKHYDDCLYLGAGDTRLGPKSCLTNPGVNVLPMGKRLWLTIDNRFWSSVDSETLATTAPFGILPLVEASTVTLNAHPACDYNGNGECLVGYPCAGGGLPGLLETFRADHLCVGRLTEGKAKRKDTDLTLVELSRHKLPNQTFLAHSHAPSLTKNFFVMKVDEFFMGKKDPRDGGMLKYMHQGESNVWLVMDRRTNQSRILTSDFSFVNNHVVNIHEQDDHIVVDCMPGTKNYLENYFRHNLANKTWMTSRWDWIMFEPKRCYVPIAADKTTIRCETLLQKSRLHNHVGMDFPTFNPFYKYDPASKWWYVTANVGGDSMWFDTVVKIDALERVAVARFHEPGVYVTESNYIPRPGATEEDDGLLFGLFYNSTADESFTAFLDAKTMKLVAKVDMGTVIPYHSHGTLCMADGKCFANP